MGGENKERRDLLRGFLSEGVHDAEIARRLGVTRQRVGFLRRHQLKLPRAGEPWVAELQRVYLSGDAFNMTALTIIERLVKGDADGAYSEFYGDGDKLPGYTDWGRKFVALLYSNLGCRLHRVPNCQMRFCVHQKGDTQE